MSTFNWIQDSLWLGKIRDKLAELGLSDDTLLYVTADHGFDEGQKTHKKAPYVFLATNDGAVTAPGNRADITPTIYAALGVETGEMEPSVDGRAL